MKSLVNFLNQDNIHEGLKLGSSKIDAELDEIKFETSDGKVIEIEPSRKNKDANIVMKWLSKHTKINSRSLSQLKKEIISVNDFIRKTDEYELKSQFAVIIPEDKDLRDYFEIKRNHASVQSKYKKDVLDDNEYIGELIPLGSGYQQNMIRIIFTKEYSKIAGGSVIDSYIPDYPIILQKQPVYLKN